MSALPERFDVSRACYNKQHARCARPRSCTCGCHASEQAQRLPVPARLRLMPKPKPKPKPQPQARRTPGDLSANAVRALQALIDRGSRR